MPVRDFDSMLAEKAGVRPTFKVGGQEFSLRHKLPYKTWNKLLAKMRAEGVDPQEATKDFFRVALTRADRERFVALMDNEGEGDGEDGEGDEDAVIDLAQMDAITDWIMEYFTGKLRNSSDSSPPGANGTGQPPNVVSLTSRSTNA